MCLRQLRANPCPAAQTNHQAYSSAARTRRGTAAACMPVPTPRTIHSIADCTEPHHGASDITHPWIQHPNVLPCCRQCCNRLLNALMCESGFIEEWSSNRSASVRASPPLGQPTPGPLTGGSGSQVAVKRGIRDRLYGPWPHALSDAPGPLPHPAARAAPSPLAALAAARHNP